MYSFDTMNLTMLWDLKLFNYVVNMFVQLWEQFWVIPLEVI
jgi:hypothetical protein